MTIEYDAIKDKDVFRMSDAIKKMCILVQDRYEISTEGRPRQIINRKYLCPCGIVNVVSSKMENPDVHTIYVASDKCGI